jgi:hypothetical protein
MIEAAKRFAALEGHLQRAESFWSDRMWDE